MGVFHFLPRALAARDDRDVLRARLAKTAAALAVGIAAFGSIFYGQATARERAGVLIAAAESYRGKYGRYPDRLPELVPEFLPEIPDVNHIAMAGRFIYSSSPDQHFLAYVVAFPFDRRVYSFENKAWSTLD